MVHLLERSRLWENNLSSEIFSEVCRIVQRYYPDIQTLPVEQCKQLNLIYSGLLDSFSVMNFILEVEDFFDIQIPADYFEDRRMHQLDSICDIIIELKR